jgi:N-acetylmuramoyl-L-alanine amidase CwlA
LLYTIKQDLLPDGFNNPNEILKPLGLVIHETADDGATDENESKYFHNNKVNASAHYFVDYNSITQLLLENKVAYHAGYIANHKYLSIELCHYNDKNKFIEVWKRGIWLSADICRRYGWNPLEKVVSHAWVSGTFFQTDHTDPLEYFAQYNKTFNDFINDVFDEINGGKTMSTEISVVNIKAGEKIVKAINIDGKTFCPVRELAEALGKVVEWNDVEKIVVIR